MSGQRGGRGRWAWVPAFVIAMLVAVGAGGAAPAVAAKPPMLCNGDASLCDRTLDRVVLAATHNSMSSAADGWALPNQPVGIASQLRLGVHGFLIDVHYGHPNPDGTVATDPTQTAASRVYLCHELCEIGASPLRAAFKAMRKHLARQPNEVLVLDVEDYVSTADLARELRRSGLAPRVYRGPAGPWPTLRQMIAARQQVVVLTEHRADGVPWIHLDYAGIVQETPYTWVTPNLLTDPAQWAASCRPNRGGTTGSLFLLNHWSPPLAPTPAGAAAVNAADVLVGRAQACAYVRGKVPNLVAVDWFTAGGLFDAVRRLNVLAGAS
jgi:hypothetical protein